jgi:hypothetical protein
MIAPKNRVLSLPRPFYAITRASSKFPMRGDTEKATWNLDAGDFPAVHEMKDQCTRRVFFCIKSISKY